MHEVIYFESPGYAEPTRLCLELSGKPWKNTVVDWDGYQELKEAGELPWGFLPVLKTPQGTIAESGAIMRYAASLAGLDSDNLYTQGKINEIIDVIDGWRTSFSPTFYIDDLDEKIAARKALFEPGAKIDAGLKDSGDTFREFTNRMDCRNRRHDISRCEGLSQHIHDVLRPVRRNRGNHDSTISSSFGISSEDGESPGHYVIL